MLSVVNMIPTSLSGEHNQDSEPNIAVNPENTNDIVATAFTPDPMGGANAPIYLSTNRGQTWALNSIVPGNDPQSGTHDITVGFATQGGVLYAGILNGATGRMQILRTSSFAAPGTMTVLVERSNEDQPWIVAGTIVASGSPRDRVFVGNNDFDQPGGGTATVDLSQDAATAPPPAGFAPVQLERRATLGQDGPPVRIAMHPDGTVYAAFHRWMSASGADVTIDIVVTRDDQFGGSAQPFHALMDSTDHAPGQRVATGRFIRWNAIMGQERLGGDLAIAVDPTDSHTVWVAWCDRVGGPAGTDWTLHIRRSTDRGQTWSADLRTITNVKNPTLAVNGNRLLGLAYQQFTGTTWDTKLELTADGWVTAITPLVLQTASASTPTPQFLPYIGDYIRMIAADDDFYGVFCGNNTPNMANFPNGVTYQRHADWTHHVLFDVNGTTPVNVSIDPLFFHWSQTITPRGLILPWPIPPRPTPGPIARGLIVPAPPEPPAPVSPSTLAQSQDRAASGVTDISL